MVVFFHCYFRTISSRPRAPFFDPSTPTKISAQIDSTAVLSCKVHNLGNHTVSKAEVSCAPTENDNLFQVAWIRHKDLHIISVDDEVFTNNMRYNVVHRSSTTDEYLLRINFVQKQDEGVYECQISTKPSFIAFHIKLDVIAGILSAN